MTDEEKAKEYVNKRPFIHLLGRNTIFIQKEFKDAILWALAEGRKDEDEKLFNNWCKGETPEPQECPFLQKLEKENAELKEKNSILKNDVRVAREDRERLQIKVGKGLQEYIKDCPYSALRYYATSKVVEENAELRKKLETKRCCFTCEHKNDCVIEDYNNVCEKWE